MAARVLLLITVTGLFATAWSSDHPEAATRQLASAAVVLPERPSSAQSVEHTLTVTEIGHAVSVPAELDTSIAMLPELISPGTYRVVDAQGQVGWLSIPLDNDISPERSATEPQPVYSTESASGRWYFIRVEAAPVIASPLGSPAVRR